MIKVNGVKYGADDALVAGKTIDEYLSSANYDYRRVAVERNYEIIPKAKYAEVKIEDGDIIEVVMFMGGGCLQPKNFKTRK